MKFYIVTPSFNQLSYLERCVASVADQATESGMRQVAGDGDVRQANDGMLTANRSLCVHHHIQDGGSTDGTPEWLAEYISRKPTTGNYQLTFASEADEGMYDAINRGWKRAVEGPRHQTSCIQARSSNSRLSALNLEDTILAQLNCDEQYLPGALQQVASFMELNPVVAAVFGDVIVMNPKGDYICSRRVVMPELKHLLTHHLATFSAATFVRASTVRAQNLYFDTSWKNCGDAEWMSRLLNGCVETGVLREFTSAFVDSGENLSLTGSARENERLRLLKMAHFWVSGLKPLWGIMHRLRKWRCGAYARDSLDYAVFQDTADGLRRVPHHQHRTTGVWRNRL